MPPEARVFTISKTPDARKMLRGWIEAYTFGDHTVVLEAEDYRTVLESIPTAKELGVNVAVVDGGMDAEWDGRVHNNFNNSRKITQALRARLPEVKIVSFAPAAKDPGFGDVHTDSRQLASIVLIEDTITNL